MEEKKGKMTVEEAGERRRLRTSANSWRRILQRNRSQRRQRLADQKEDKESVGLLRKEKHMKKNKFPI